MIYNWQNPCTSVLGEVIEGFLSHKHLKLCKYGSKLVNKLQSLMATQECDWKTAVNIPRNCQNPGVLLSIHNIVEPKHGKCETISIEKRRMRIIPQQILNISLVTSLASCFKR